MKTLHINGKQVEVSEVTDDTKRGAGNGWVIVYVDGNSSCHKLPEKWFSSKGGSVLKTSGNTYSFM